MAKRVRQSIRKWLEPALEEAGFLNRYPHFQRHRAGQLDLLSVLRDKWGGGLYLEFARHATGDLTTAWGEVVPEAKVDVAYANPETRARLLASTRLRGDREGLFRYAELVDDATQCDALIQSVVDCLPQVFAWLEAGEVGPNIAPYAPKQGAS